MKENPGFRGDVGMMGISGKILESLDSVMLDDLERLNVVTRINVPLSFDNKIVLKTGPNNHLRISQLGKAFVRACRLPRAMPRQPMTP